MRTDDFFADLEVQLRAAQPEPRTRRVLRLVPPALATAAAVVVAILFIGRGGDTTEKAVPAGTGKVTVHIVNATGAREGSRDLAVAVRQAGFAPDGPVELGTTQRESHILAGEGHVADGERLAKALGLSGDSVLTGYAPVGSGEPPALNLVIGTDLIAESTVTDGGMMDAFRGPRTVAIREQSGRPSYELALEAVFDDAGINWESGASQGVNGDMPATSVLGRDRADDKLIARVREAMGLERAAPAYATKPQRRDMDGARVIVYVGKDYRLPPGYKASDYKLP